VHSSATATRKIPGPGAPPKAEIDVDHVILVLSGKGGVGKSTVAVNLSFALSAHGYNVGVLDLDIHGPISRKMLGLEGHHLTTLGKMIQLSGSPGISPSSPWHFSCRTRALLSYGAAHEDERIGQFLSEVDWGHLDFLVVDLPPGTGDEALSIVQLAPT
jgi:Mrp family chromosome partitioning ATPase